MDTEYVKLEPQDLLELKPPPNKKRTEVIFGTIGILIVIVLCVWAFPRLYSREEEPTKSESKEVEFSSELQSRFVELFSYEGDLGTYTTFRIQVRLEICEQLARRYHKEESRSIQDGWADSYVSLLDLCGKNKEIPHSTKISDLVMVYEMSERSMQRYNDLKAKGH